MDNDVKFRDAILKVLKHEGHFSNNPVDPGGPTNYGVSLRYLKSLGVVDPTDGYLLGDMDHDGDIDVEDIRAMTPEEAMRIYRSQWWDRYGYEQIADGPLAAKVLDLSVNMGPGRAHRLLQAAVNWTAPSGAKRIAEDGRLGSISFAAINCHPCAAWLLAEFQLRAIDFYTDLKKTVFLEGWIRRALD